MPVESTRGFGYWRDPLLLVCAAIYVINRLVIKPNLHHYSPFFHGHLNDTLTVPVALPLYLYVYRRIGFRPDDGVPRWWEIALHLAVWSVFFEWFGPLYLHRGVADPIDVWCMAGGGIFSWAFWHASSLRRWFAGGPAAI